MLDVKRHNEIIRLAMNGHREDCKTDEEREMYDDVRWEYEDSKDDGMVFDLIHDSEG